MNKFIQRFQHLPVASTGLALGIGGFGNCVATIFSLNNYNSKWITCISMSIVLFILFLMIIKNLIHPKVLHYELHDQLLVSFLPTFSMCLMLVAGFVGSWDNQNQYSTIQIIAAIIMCIALIIQFIVLAFFIKSFFKNHIKNKEKMYGTYFVPTVGLITSCTVANNVILLPNELFQAIWYFGYFCFIVTLPIITYSMLFKHDAKFDEHFPSTIVWFAPANLSCAGFIQTFLLSAKGPYKNGVYPQTFLFALFLLTAIIGFTVSLLMYLYIYRIFRYRFKKKIKGFQPILCSMSFPCAIGSMAMILVAKFLSIYFFGQTNIVFDDSKQLEFTIVYFFAISGFVFSILTTIILSYLLFNMLKLIFKALFTNQYDEKKHKVYEQVKGEK